MDLQKYIELVLSAARNVKKTGEPLAEVNLAVNVGVVKDEDGSERLVAYEETNGPARLHLEYRV